MRRSKQAPGTFPPPIGPKLLASPPALTATSKDQVDAPVVDPIVFEPPPALVSRETTPQPLPQPPALIEQAFSEMRVAEIPALVEQVQPPIPKWDIPGLTESEQAPLSWIPDLRDSAQFVVRDETTVQPAGPSALVGYWKIVSLYNPDTVPVRGMLSALAPSALKPGEFQLLQNLRVDESGMRVRYGASAISTGEVVNTDIFCGGSVLRVNGVPFAFEARYDGTQTHLYMQPFPALGALAPTAWTLITGTTTKYGDTRLGTDQTDVTFQVVKEIDTYLLSSTWNNREYVLVQNGLKPPRLIDPTGGTAADRCSIINSIPNLNPQTLRYEPTWFYYFTLNTGAGEVLDSSARTHGSHSTNTGTVFTFEGTTPGPNPINFDDFILCRYASTSISSTDIKANTAQLHIIYKCRDPFIWQKIQVCILNTPSPPTLPIGTYYVVHNPYDDTTPVDGDFDPIIVPLGGEYYLAAFKTDNIKTTGGALLPDGVTINTLMFLWRTGTNLQPATDLDLTVIGAGFGAKARGGASFGATLYNSGSHTESAGVVARSEGGPRVCRVGGALVTGQYVRLPISTSLFYRYRLFWTVPTISNTVNRGLDYLLVYMKPGGLQTQQFDYTLHAPLAISDYTTPAGVPTWANKAAYPALTIAEIFVDTDETTLRPMPDALHVPVPIASAQVSASGRLFVGNVKIDSGDSYAGGVWISEDQSPFRFRRFVKFLEANAPDMRSATRFELSGESVTGFARLSTSTLGADGVLVFTDKSVWAIDGIDALQLSRPRKIGPHGTRAPRSIAEYHNSVYWMGSDRQVRVLSSDMQSISLGRVDDLLFAISSSTVADIDQKVAGCVHRDRYYLSFTSGSEGTNKRVLVYDMRRDLWTMDKFVSLSAMQMFSVDLATLKRLIAFTTYGRMFEHEMAGIGAPLTKDLYDAGTPTYDDITVKITTREFVSDWYKPVGMRRLGMVADAQAVADITTKRYGRGGGASVNFPTLQYPYSPMAGYFKLALQNTGETVVWRWDYSVGTASGTHPGLSSVGVYGDYEGPMLGGSRIYSLMAEVSGMEKDGSISSYHL